MTHDLADQDKADSAASAWIARFGTADEPDPELLVRLAADARRVAEYVDKNLAHCDRDGNRFKVTYDELERAINDVSAIANDTSLLVRGAAVGYDNVMIDGDWQGRFDPHCFRMAKRTHEARLATVRLLDVSRNVILRSWRLRSRFGSTTMQSGRFVRWRRLV